MLVDLYIHVNCGLYFEKSYRLRGMEEWRDGGMSPLVTLTHCNWASFLQLYFFKKTYQFINVVNGVSRSHKQQIYFFSFDSVA